mmetsp:Transcript_68431/g.117518  ORF Transcript_68431/g.117518 Transcript_68431/m.117518 type:complete len:370 (+) Transcript_68431:34-1143(+)
MHAWAHSCCSKESLSAALASDEVDSIESDIVVSSVTGEPVMAHPPLTHSDLSFQAFMISCIEHNAAALRKSFQSARANFTKHIKLDFKDLAAVSPCLKFLANKREDIAAGGATVWLNADVLPGPGTRPESVTIPADGFVAECKVCVLFEPSLSCNTNHGPYLNASSKNKIYQRLYPEGILSLGWKTALQSPNGGGAYTREHCAAMRHLCARHGDLGGDQSRPVVFAVCARLVAADPLPLLALLAELPGAALLVWTGSGEPPVSSRLVENIKCAFRSLEDVEHASTTTTVGTASGTMAATAMLQSRRIGFDVAIASWWGGGVFGDAALALARSCPLLVGSLKKRGARDLLLFFSVMGGAVIFAYVPGAAL